MSSPRTWGCFSALHARKAYRGVFPTHVGVFLKEMQAVSEMFRLPHARGGVSKVTETLKRVQESSPRTWGCFRLWGRLDEARRVFPTHVGVFLI